MASLDLVFDLLSDKRRRYALYYLEQEGNAVHLDDMAAQVAKWEADPALAPITEEAYRKVVLELHHTSLPKAAEAEYITYDADEGVVELTGDPPDFKAITSIAKVIERPDRYP